MEHVGIKTTSEIEKLLEERQQFIITFGIFCCNNPRCDRLLYREALEFFAFKFFWFWKSIK